MSKATVSATLVVPRIRRSLWLVRQRPAGVFTSSGLAAGWPPLRDDLTFAGGRGDVPTGADRHPAALFRRRPGAGDLQVRAGTVSRPAAAAFIAAERLVAARGGVPLLDVRLLAIPVVRWSLAALMTATGTYYVLLFTVAQYLQGGLGRSPVQSGLTHVRSILAKLGFTTRTEVATWSLRGSRLARPPRAPPCPSPPPR
jgi:hypothetical protein